MPITVTIPHQFFNKSGNVPASQLDDDFNVLAAAVNTLGAALAGGPRGTVAVADTSLQGWDWAVQAVNVQVYGVRPASSASANRVGLQAAHDALPAGGGALYIPRGIYNVDGAVTFTKPVMVTGDGEASELILTSPTSDLFFVTTTNACTFRDLFLSGQAAASSGALIRFDTGGLSNQRTRIDNVTFFSGWEQVRFDRGAYWKITNCNFMEFRSSGLFQANPNFSGDEGDQLLAGNHFVSVVPLPTKCVAWISGGGTKIVGNKMLTAGGSGALAGIALEPAAGITTGAMVIVGNSIEGAQYGILAQSPAGGSIHGIVINGNQIAGQTISHIAINQMTGVLIGIGITGNVMLFGATPGMNYIALIACFETEISGNMMEAVGLSDTAISLDAAALIVEIGQNKMSGFGLNPIIAATTDTLVTGAPHMELSVLFAARVGSQVYCTNCTPGSSPCTGGSGAMAFRQGGVWKCF